MTAAREIKRHIFRAKKNNDLILGANTPKSKRLLYLVILSGGKTY